MKKLSKLLSVLLCLAMVLGIFAMAVGADGETTYNIIDKVEDLTAGTYYMGGYLTSYQSNDWTATPYHLYTGSLGTSNGNTDCYTSEYSYSNGILTIDTADADYPAAIIELVAVSGKANTYYVKTGNQLGQYLCSTAASNRKLSLTDTATEWVASNNAKGGITLTTTVGTDTVSLGIANASSKMLRTYTNESSLASGLLFFKEGVYTPPATVNVTGVTVDETATVQVGLSTTLTATVAPDNATNQTVAWTSSDNTVATVSDGKVIGVKAGTATITATTEDGSFTDTCTVTVTAGPVMLDAPTNGSSYKFGLAQKGLSKYLWFSGEMDGYYLGTTENFEEAVDVIPVAVEGGWHISFVKDNVTKYIEIYEYQAGSLAVQITDAPTTVHTWDATAKTFFAALAEKIRFMGTYGTNDTISSSDTWRITGDNAAALDVTQYVAHLYAIPVTGVTVAPATQNLTVGGTANLAAAVDPTNATNQTVAWTTSDDTVATVDATGKVTAVGVGNATITATTADGSKTATCTVSVTNAVIHATGVTLDKTSETLNVGGEVNLTATVAPADTTDSVTWSTSDANVATVAGGKVTAVGVGTATITAKAGDKTATCTITVDPVVSKVELNQTTASVTVGGETTLTATVTVNPNTDTYKTVTWATSDATVATVENGKVKALKAGTVKITATSVTDTTKKAECTITVTEPAPSVTEGKITSLDQLVTGTYVMVVKTGYAPGVYENGWLTAVQPTIEGDKVTDAKGGIWTLTVADGKVTIKDANGVTVAPKGGNKNGITEGDYQWIVTCENGKFIFAGAGEDTVYLASNTASNYGNKFRGYKVSTCKPETTESNSEYATVEYPYEFTLYAVASTGDSGNTGDDTTGDDTTTGGDTGNTGDTGSSETTKTEYTVQSTPTAGKSYKYGLYQAANKTQLWFTGEMDGYYLAMSQDVKDAVDVTVEAVEGGYRLSFTKDGVKKYIDIVERTDKEGSANVIITDEPTAVLTWDATAKTFFTKIGENTFYLGTYNTYKTISASNITYITGDNASKVDVSQYVSHLYLDQPSSTGDAFEPMVIILALAAVSALAVLVLNKKKFSF